MISGSADISVKWHHRAAALANLAAHHATPDDSKPDFFHVSG
jgi:hypothetical protein